MNEPMRFASPEYPVLYAVGDPMPDEGMIPVSLALLVGGIPSFLGSVPVEAPLLEGLVASLDAGDVRVVVEGIRIGEDELAAEGASEGAPDTSPDTSPAPSPDTSPEGAPDGPYQGGGFDDPATPARAFPAALLSLACADGRRVGVARIVSRDAKADPASVARFVHRQITRGVQLLDLAQAN
jgi:hypothetical protein